MSTDTRVATHRGDERTNPLLLNCWISRDVVSALTSGRHQNLFHYRQQPTRYRFKWRRDREKAAEEYLAARAAVCA